ncbi:hypothetical cytosolic protein [Syntrophus aciditrophicus SB]|uniref:Hypothetical cytosolic protein n=1 Tax=Syntrophus aciditrophicus (strain SB) TaxID=56780 RepID=Q2LR27_SYNAS|nr:hypothetical cytosolic protein [Syntrophus aciditrophicus SB]
MELLTFDFSLRMKEGFYSSSNVKAAVVEFPESRRQKNRSVGPGFCPYPFSYENALNGGFSVQDQTELSFVILRPCKELLR